MRVVRRATFLEQTACLQIPVPVLKFLSAVHDGCWLLGGGLAPGGCRVVDASRRASFLPINFSGDRGAAGVERGTCWDSNL